MVPILFGVVLLTFILFNVVGGSPAAFVLGKNASAKALDEFDRQFGYSKPLFFGRKLKTRLITGHFEGLETQKYAEKDGFELVLPLNYALNHKKRYFLRLDGENLRKNAVLLRLSRKKGTEEKTEKIPLKRSFFGVSAEFLVSEEVKSGENIVLGLVFDEKRPILPEKVEIFEVSDHFWNSQFLDYLVRLAHFDLGVSASTNQRVGDILRQGVWPSLALNVPILLGGLVVSVVLALLCAWRRGRFFDRVAVFAATGLMSVNYIVWIVAGQYFFAYRLGWFPIWGFESWRYLLLPVAIGIVSGLGKDVRFYRTVMLDEVYRDYVRTARAKGVSDGAILFRHVLRNALVPIITNVSLTLPFLFTGSLLLETFFGIPGLGGISVNAINSSDLAVVQAVVLVGALLYVVINLLTDICYGLVDPRIRLK
jgi:peptide/nickel transport system permease protein